MTCLSYLRGCEEVSTFYWFVKEWCDRLGCYAEEYDEGIYILKRKAKLK